MGVTKRDTASVEYSSHRVSSLAFSGVSGCIGFGISV